MTKPLDPVAWAEEMIRLVNESVILARKVQECQGKIRELIHSRPQEPARTVSPDQGSDAPADQENAASGPLWDNDQEKDFLAHWESQIVECNTVEDLDTCRELLIETEKDAPAHLLGRVRIEIAKMRAGIATRNGLDEVGYLTDCLMAERDLWREFEPLPPEEVWEPYIGALLRGMREARTLQDFNKASRLIDKLIMRFGDHIPIKTLEELLMVREKRRDIVTTIHKAKKDNGFE